MAMAEVLCYNEMTPHDKMCPNATKPLVPQCFYVQGNHIKFILFEGGDHGRIHMFRKYGIFHTLEDTSWNSRFTPYTIRRIGEDPRLWVNQALDAYASFSRNLLSMTPPPDACQLEHDVIVHARELISEIINVHTRIVHLEEATFPIMVNRVHRIYGVTLHYEKTSVPCTEAKPCLHVKCMNCKTKENAFNVRRYVAQAFLEPEYRVKHAPEFVQTIWRRSEIDCSSA
jgi:hypothetical protein